jgi:hypothetical protein
MFWFGLVSFLFLFLFLFLLFLFLFLFLLFLFCCYCFCFCFCFYCFCFCFCLLFLFCEVDKAHTNVPTAVNPEAEVMEPAVEKSGMASAWLTATA